MGMLPLIMAAQQVHDDLHHVAEDGVHAVIQQRMLTWATYSSRVHPRWSSCWSLKPPARRAISASGMLGFPMPRAR